MARQRFHSQQPNNRQVKTIERTMTSQHKHNYSHYDMAVEEDDGIELGNVFIIVCSFLYVLWWNTSRWGSERTSAVEDSH